MSDLARKAGLGRQALYTALSENGNPTLETLTSVLDALGLQLTVSEARRLNPILIRSSMRGLRVW